MDFLKLFADDASGIERMSRLATAILKKYYDPIVGEEQNDYMLEKFQSIESIQKQLIHDYSYYFLSLGDKEVGFIAFYTREDALYLSKFYLSEEYRGKGYAKEILSFILSCAKERGLNAIELNVNKHNPTRFIYEKLGFRLIRSEKNDIGMGYYMDDYVYRLEQ